jgi:hypothetical protein
MDKNLERILRKVQKENVWCDVLLTSFKTPIKYDYPIPDIYRIMTSVEKTIKVSSKTNTTFNKIADHLHSLVFSFKDESSPLEMYLNRENLFGSEWFYGYGTLYRWRSGEESAAIDRINKLISKKEQHFISDIQSRITHNLTSL